MSRAKTKMFKRPETGEIFLFSGKVWGRSSTFDSWEDYLSQPDRVGGCKRGYYCCCVFGHIFNGPTGKCTFCGYAGKIGRQKWPLPLEYVKR